MNSVNQEQSVERHLDAFNASLHAEDAASLKVQRVLHHIHEHLFDEVLSVGSTLRACGIRSHGFSSRFKAELGQTSHGWHTIGEYIEKQRIEAAKHVLRHYEGDLVVLAVHLGFHRYQTFRRAFRRRVGCPPSTFRAKVMGENDGRK